MYITCTLSPKTLCVFYVIVNLIKVKRTSVAVVIILIILFCVRISWQNMLEYLHKDTFNTGLYFIKVC